MIVGEKEYNRHFLSVETGVVTGARPAWDLFDFKSISLINLVHERCKPRRSARSPHGELLLEAKMVTKAGGIVLGGRHRQDQGRLSPGSRRQHGEQDLPRLH